MNTMREALPGPQKGPCRISFISRIVSPPLDLAQSSHSRAVIASWGRLEGDLAVMCWGRDCPVRRKCYKLQRPRTLGSTDHGSNAASYL